MKKIITILALLIFTVLSGYSQIHYVSHDIPGDYPTIVSAMDAAGMHDTIIIRPGTYNEYMVVQDKGLTFASMYLLNPDPDYIHQTIIDGEKHIGHFYLLSLTHPVSIYGLTLINGAGSRRTDQLITSFGGSCCIYSCEQVNICHCKINNCYATNGGAIDNYRSKIFLSDVSIRNNYAQSNGGGIVSTGQNAFIEFDTVFLNSIYNNYSGSLGCDIVITTDKKTEIHLDTASANYTDPYFTIIPDKNGYPTGLLTLYVNHNTVNLIDSDLYVASWGSNSNSGISPNAPFKSLTHALIHFKSDSIEKHTIHLDDGIYSPESTGDLFPVQLKSYLTISGNGPENTIITHDSTRGFFFSYASNKQLRFDGFSIKNSIDPDGISHSFLILNSDTLIINNLVLDNIQFEWNPGFQIYSAKFVSISDTKILNCTGTIALSDTDFGSNPNYTSQHTYNNLEISGLKKSSIEGADGATALSLGLNIDYGTTIPHKPTYNIINSSFSQNKGTNSYFQYPYLAFLKQGYFNFYNCTFGDNYSTSVGGVVLRSNSSLGIYNSIFYNNYHPSNIVFDYDENRPPEPNCVTIANTLFEGGYAAIEDQHPTPGYNTINYDATNFEDNPLWLNSGEFPYSLMPESPCIDRGSMDYYDTIPLPEYDMAGNPRVWGEAIDLGAYEYQGVHPYAPGSETISCNIYPNPFFHETRIEVLLQYTSEVRVEIFSSNGRRITSPASGTYPPGIFTTYWNGFDKRKNNVPDGLYIVRVTVNGKHSDFKVVKGGE